MFGSVKSKLKDISTIKKLCEGAEAYALEDQQREPGAEHFLLAALDLPDATGRRAFEHVGADPEGLENAIRRQYDDALLSIGLAEASASDGSLPPNTGLYHAAPSGQAVMEALAASRVGHHSLLGAHVVSVVAGFSGGVAARALRVMDVDPVELKSAADAIIEGFPTSA